MVFTVVCHGCGKLLYKGTEMIPLYRLRKRTYGDVQVVEEHLHFIH